MATELQCRFTTTILIKNIHCRSCETTIYRTLQDLRPAIQDVQVNTLRQELRITHKASLDVLKVCTALHDAAFEVHSLLTMDDEKRIQVREIEFKDEDSLFEGLCYPTRPQILKSPLQRRVTRHSLDRTAAKHIENCESCRKELASQERTNLRPNESKRKLQDLEAGDIGSLSLNDSVTERLEQIDYDPLGFLSGTPGSAPLPEQRAKKSSLDTTNGKYEVVLSIGGMTCAACTSSVSHGVSELSYVESVSVTLMTNSATVVFKGRQNLDNLVEVVEDMGYECSVQTCDRVDENEQTAAEFLEERRRTVMLKIDGMFCGHCPDRIREAIRSQFSDVVEISKPPSMKDPIMILSYVPKAPILTIRDIIEAVNGANEVFTAHVYTPPTIEERSEAMQRRESRRLLQRLVISFVVGIPTLLIGVVWMSLVPASNSLRKYFEEPVLKGAVSRSDWALFFLATTIMLLAADTFHVRAYKEIRALWRKGSRVPYLQRFTRFGSMNMLLSAGTGVAYFSSVAVIAIKATSKPSVTSPSSTYFDSVVFLTFFILIGRWLEAYSRAKTGNAVAMLGSLRPDKVILVSGGVDTSSMEDEEKTQALHESITTIDSKLLEVNDVIQLPHGSSPPADGTVVSGATSFNESSLTGEARAVRKVTGDTVYAGSVNVGDAVQVRVEEVTGTSMLDQIISVVREGQTKRAPVERVVDTVTGYFVPVITLLAIITFVIWLLLGTLGALQSRHINPQQGGWAFWSLEFAIAVFVVACPCGFGLAAPTALFVGSGLAAKHGILVRGGGEAFQEASNIDCVVFDKTGTLTDGGNLRVTDHELLVEGIEAEAAWAITKALEETSSHPLAQALVKFADEHPSNTRLVADSTSEEPGRGVSGFFTNSSGTSYEAKLGSEALISTLIPDFHENYYISTTLNRWKSEAKSVALLAMRRSSPTTAPQPYTLALIAAISDPIRPSAHTTLAALKTRNIPTYMLTGDNPITASAVAATLFIPQDHVFAGVLPTEKAAKIRQLQDPHHPSSPLHLSHKSKNKKTAIVAFVGDGINDAPALTAANVSISLSSATDIAMHSSSFILLSPSNPLASIPTLIDLSQRVFRRVELNFGWALVYNAVLVPVAAGGLFWVKEGGWRLGPVWGSAAMALSSVCVVLSSLALRLEPGWWRRGR